MKQQTYTKYFLDSKMFLLEETDHWALIEERRAQYTDCKYGDDISKARLFGSNAVAKG